MAAKVSLEKAEEVLLAYLRRAGFKGPLEYDRAKAVETDRWWYIPHGWIGCFGSFVDKADWYVDWLGSGMFSIQDCFWAHDHGITNGLVDFSVRKCDDLSVLFDLFRYFRRLVPRSSDPTKLILAQFREPEIRWEINQNYPEFRNHHVWSGIGILKKYADRGEIEFSCTRVSDPPLNYLERVEW